MYYFWQKERDSPDWSFQLKAVSRVVGAFEKKKLGRFLLVLPTGGGKTLTAIRIINEMLSRNLISESDRVLWIVHTLFLQKQTQDDLEDPNNYLKFNLDPRIKSIIEVRMKSKALQELQSEKKYKLIVIDEAHHSTASSYNKFFEYPVGILGLTATPQRTDSKSLPFEGVSYSTTFRDLIRRKVVLTPKFLPDIKTGFKIDSTSLSDLSELEKFNSVERNKFISKIIFNETAKHQLKKIVVFTGTNKHVKDLFEEIKDRNQTAQNPFNHIGYIYGNNNNEKGIPNDKYLEWHQTQDSSILVNCKILNEGYDDPNIDTVVMATPTNSILYYMQCIGRVVRTPQNHKTAKAFVVEIVDKLPNISYRIDNRWLFSEISDYLEPRIIDVKYPWPLRPALVGWNLLRLNAKVTDLSWDLIKSILIGKTINLLLFNDIPHKSHGKWRILPMLENDLEIIRAFNDLSENIEEYYELNYEYIMGQRHAELIKRKPTDTRATRSSFIGALHRASTLKEQKLPVDSLIYLSVH